MRCVCAHISVCGVLGSGAPVTRSDVRDADQRSGPSDPWARRAHISTIANYIIQSGAKSPIWVLGDHPGDETRRAARCAMMAPLFIHGKESTRQACTNGLTGLGKVACPAGAGKIRCAIPLFPSRGTLRKQSHTSPKLILFLKLEA